MSRCQGCPIQDGPCFGELHPFACKFAGPEANPTQRRFLADQSARLGDAPPPTPPPPDAYPPLARQVRNLFGSAFLFAASGGKRVDAEEVARRQATCRACPTGRYDPDQDRCRGCGCFVAIKPWGAAERCPDGHW